MKRKTGLRVALGALVCAAVLTLAACPPPGGWVKGKPLIGASVISYPAGSLPEGFQNVGVIILDSYDGSPLGSALVSVNGAQLPYSFTGHSFGGTVRLSPGDAVSLSVTVGGKTYSTSGTLFDSYPSISTPASSASLLGIYSNEVRWSGGSLAEEATSYLVGVLDASDPSGPLVWPSDNTFQEVSLGTTSAWIPANTLAAGSYLMLAGILKSQEIPSASEGSFLTICAFDVRPFAVAGSSEIATVQVAPANPAVPLGVTLAFTATGTSGDGRSENVTSRVHWQSSDPGVATVSNEAGSAGIATPASSGPTTITASLGGASGSATLDVRPWILRTSGTTNALYGITWSGTQFMAVGDGGAVLMSPDALTWTERSSGTMIRACGVAWSGAEFVMVGDGTYSSPDGISWTRASSEGASGIMWSGSQFVAVGGHISTSPDGTTWTVRDSGQFFGAAWSGTKFVAVGAYGIIKTSPDGVTWTEVLPRATSAFLNSVIWTGDRFVAVGAYDSSFGAGVTLTSPDGVSWTAHASGATGTLNGVASSGNRIVAAGDNGNLWVSTDGANWTSQSLATGRWGEHFRGIVWSGERFVAVGNFGIVLTSVEPGDILPMAAAIPGPTKSRDGVLRAIMGRAGGALR